MEPLNGRIAVVTGAASGIGYALAEAAAEHEMKVVMADIDDSALGSASGTLRAAGAEVLDVVTDVSQPGSVDDLAETVFEHFGTAHLVCNNAGVVIGGPLWTLSAAEWEWVLGVNLFGVVNGIRAFVPRLIKQGEGHVVNTASILGVVAIPMVSPYVASKHAVVGLSESLLHDLRMVGSPIGVSVVCPSWVNTRIMDAERNWPDRLGPPPEMPEGADQMREGMRQLFENGLDPADVAKHVFDAVLADRFWVFPEPNLAGIAAARMAGAAQGKAPSMPTLMPAGGV